MAKYDKEAVRLAAAGQWGSILPTIGGIPAEVLDGKHHPCSQCGGEDRFRAFDDFEQTGGMLCNQCFAKDNGDGFSAIQWLTGCKFGEAVEKVAEHLGVAPKQSKKKDPAKDLQFQPWASALVAHFLRRKPGVDESALLSAGARLAKYKRSYTVVALPIIGEKLDTAKPVGWVLMNCLGDSLPKWNREGEVVGQVKVKITYGSSPGLLGIHALERLNVAELPEVVWKVEGVSDLLALLTAMPEQLRERHLVVTNANGAGETPRWPAAVLSNHATNVLHDADEPGQAGAETWATAIATQSSGKPVRNVRLPFDIEKDHGKDLRDYLLGGATYGDLLNLADQAEPIKVKKTESGEVDYGEFRNPIYEQILKKLQIEVLYEDEGGSIRVFSTLLRKSSTVRQVDRLKQETLIQIAGPPAMVHVSSDPSGEDEWTIGDVRKAFAFAACTRRGKDDERGIGIWQGLDDFGNETETIVLVGDSEAARWNGDQVLRKIMAPRADGLVLDFGAGEEDWYEFGQLEKNLASSADEQWCENAIQQSIQLFSRWRWRNQEVDPALVTGLIMSTWVQTIWRWRPLVSVTGESNAGKSYLFEALGGGDHGMGIFGRLSFKQEKSTAAGIRQGVGNKAVAVLCDEFEASKERTKILEMLRAATRGGKIAQGSTSQKVKEYKLRHIAWVAAIEAGLTRQPDLNRFVLLELLKPKRADHGKLTLPSGRELFGLGQKLLAVAVRHAIEAKRVAHEIRSVSCDDVDARAVESYAVIAAMLGAARRFDVERTQGLLLDLLSAVERSEQGHTDQDELLDAILSAGVNCGGKDGVLAVGQILEDRRSSWFNDHWARVEAQGVKLTDDDGLFICHKKVAQDLMRGTSWEGQRLDQFLLRISGTKRVVLRLAGRSARGVVIPSSKVDFGDQKVESF